MSGRKLGGGRVLGSGKGLAPPVSPAMRREAAASPAVSSAISAPSDNSTFGPGSPAASLSPSTSSQLRDFAQDLTSNISLAGPSDVSSATSTKLVCPICNDEMLTLLQLNRHIDDTHQELPDFEHDEVKSWIDKQVLRAKRFQPLSLLNQKLRGLDVFESNESLPPTTTPTPASGARVSRAPGPDPSPVDPDDLITTSHWQRSGPNDPCTDPACGKRLGAVNGSVNCRQCGRLFCEEHTMYQMKLSRSAAHEPVRGYWYRVCETCYKSREGYNDHNGFVRDHTQVFTAARRERVDKQTLEISRLEKRLTKLTQLLANPPAEIPADRGGGGGGGSLLSPVSALGGQRNPRKLLEQSVVTWEEDAKVARCPFCQQDFGSWTFRRHHCRICGKVVCADPQTGCSSEVGLSVAASASASPSLSATPVTSTEKEQALSTTTTTTHLDIRMCRECKGTIFAKRDFAAAIAHKPPDQRAYETLRQFERGIELLLPTFQRALVPLQDETNPPTHEQLREAAKLRKRLTDSFTKYDVAARRIRDLKTDSVAQKRLQMTVYQAASSFLHMHMLPLKGLPRLLKGGSGGSLKNRLNGNGHHHVGSPLRNGDALLEADTASSQTSEVSRSSTLASAALEIEEKELRERLVVLEEQRYMVNTMIENASRGKRRFEEVGALTRNAEELDREIEGLRMRVGEVEGRWRGFFLGGG